jgi:hypothetical protein
MLGVLPPAAAGNKKGLSRAAAEDSDADQVRRSR